MRFDEYRRHDAVSLAGLIAKREVSANEVLETAITRAEQVNPAINAIVHKQYEQARKAVAAGLPGGPLKGAPYLIKDLGFFETGEPAAFGSSLFKGFVADHDTAYVTRCKKAGLVFPEPGDPYAAPMPMAPDAGEGWGGLSTGHVVSRTVRDSALMPISTEKQGAYEHG